MQRVSSNDLDNCLTYQQKSQFVQIITKSIALRIEKLITMKCYLAFIVKVIMQISLVNLPDLGIRKVTQQTNLRANSVGMTTNNQLLGT